MEWTSSSGEGAQRETALLLRQAETGERKGRGDEHTQSGVWGGWARHRWVKTEGQLRPCQRTSQLQLRRMAERATEQREAVQCAHTDSSFPIPWLPNSYDAPTPHNPRMPPTLSADPGRLPSPPPPPTLPAALSAYASSSDA